MKCFINISDKINSYLRKDLQIKKFIDPKKWSTHDWVHTKIYEVLNDKGLRKLESLDPQIDAIVFRLEPNSFGTIHKDTDGEGNLIPFGMNWVLQGEGVMEWFNPSQPHNREPGDFSPYPHWTEDIAGQPIDSWNGKNALVRTDIPHRVYNTSNIVRVCFAIKFNCTEWEMVEEWILKNE